MHNPITVQDKVEVYIRFMTDHGEIPSFRQAYEVVESEYAGISFFDCDIFYQYLQREQESEAVL